MLGLACFAATRPVRADVLWEWNDAALAAVVGTKQLAFVQNRMMTLLDVAMYEAVNAVERRYEPYAFRTDPVPGASAEAAAAAAGRAILLALFPEQRGAWDQLYATSLARVADAQARERGVSVGERAAAAILALRANDGAEAPNSYRPTTRPGHYVPTALAVGSTWMKVKPWTLDSCDQFRPPSPPALDSRVWQRDYDEIRALGGRSSPARSASQTEAARFWTMTGPAAQWPVIRSLSAATGRSLVQNAHLLALASMAVADAYTAVFDAKYQYLFWRPVTAIRNGGGAREPLAEETMWEPLVDTPMHPEYPCAHCITAGAAAAVLEAEFGAGAVPPMEMTSLTAPGVKHRWTTLRAWEEEVANARIWGGIHYRNSAEVGSAMGHRIAEWVLRKQLQPVAQR
ncbi:MAG TPA: vanadium-dependent haloperoxidase [Anaeromyxobacteraceae bacterium]|nr:vanadium-dependent haloperoxidase [Anaeromyxobacteraceae bacterium]